MIRVENLNRRFGEFCLTDICLAIGKGSFFLLSGENGAGKTLLLETLAGFWKPDSGKVFIRGCDMTAAAPEERGIGFVYQDLWLFPHLTARENICYGLRIRGMSRQAIDKRIAHLDSLLEIGDLLLRKNVTLLSGGERQKLALARTLAVDPDILFFDEPTHMLDSESIDRLHGVIERLSEEQGKTVIYISHREEKIKDRADLCGRMDRGRLTMI